MLGYSLGLGVKVRVWVRVRAGYSLRHGSGFGLGYELGYGLWVWVWVWGMSKLSRIARKTIRDAIIVCSINYLFNCSIVLSFPTLSSQWIVMNMTNTCVFLNNEISQ